MSDSPSQSISDLRSGIATLFACYLESAKEDFAFELTSIRADQPIQDSIALKIFPDVPSEPVEDIRREESIRILFDLTDEKEPCVQVLRDDFPSIAHVNPQLNPDKPKSICLYESAWEDRRLTWNNCEFLARIFRWFRDAANGVLHRDDQGLEPLYMASIDQCILPDDLIQQVTEKANLLNFDTVRRSTRGGRALYVGAPTNGNERVTVKILGLEAAPRIHGQIQMYPRNLGQLLDALGDGRSDFFQLLIENIQNSDSKDSSPFMLLVKFPMKRTEESEVEKEDLWLFTFDSNLYGVGEILGIYGGAEEHGFSGKGVLLNAPEPTEEEYAKVRLLPLKVIRDLNRSRAQAFGGVDDCEKKLVLIGSGALGSQIHMNLARVGWGKWTVVDHDFLLPHNVVRHASNQSMVGQSKAAISEIASSWLSTENQTSSVCCNVLRPEEKEDSLNSACRRAEVVLDCSASVAVARHLARDIETDARRASAFIGAGLNSLVFLGEGAARTAPLDWLEMLLYREALGNDDVSSSLRDKKKLLNYTNSCRDRSVQLAQDVVGICSGIGSKTLRFYCRNDYALVRAYRIQDDNSVSCSAVEPTVPTFADLDGWQVLWDEVLQQKLASLRADKLPSETGGVLLGARDTQRRVIYLVDALDAPPDSESSPKDFVRGVAHLKDRLDDVARLTAGGLEYIGEWHSHPEGHTAMPSSTDMNAIAELKFEAKRADLPVLMAISGDFESFSLSLS